MSFPLQLLSMGFYGRKRLAADTTATGPFFAVKKVDPADTVTYVNSGCASVGDATDVPQDGDPVPDTFDPWPAQTVRATGGAIWCYYAKKQS